MAHQECSEIRDGMRIDWDVPVEMDDGLVLRADVYRPVIDARYPVIMTSGPYGKWLHFEDLYADQWQRMCDEHPEVAANSTNKYQNWEVVDPEKWVRDEYVVVRVDSRGAGRSPGILDLWSLREARDFHDAIEWAADQAWSNGKIGLNGISYYAMNQWQTAALQPPHLEAICVWEGAADFYRDLSHHGGIYCRFADTWFSKQVVPLQHGQGTRSYRSRMNGDWVAGPETLSEQELRSNRHDFAADCYANPLATSDFWTSRTPVWSDVTSPLLSSANWGGHGLHARGNFEGFTNAGSEAKWLEVHGLEHWTEFYTEYGVGIQKQFFDHFLKGEDTGWEERPRVTLLVRHPDDEFVQRHEDEWPLERTQWTPFYLHGATQSLSTELQTEMGTITYGGLSEGVTFLTAPLDRQMEVTGPIAAKLWISSETADADLFLVVRVFTPDLEEVTFTGAIDQHTPVAQGWLRASHRKLDENLSLPYRPYHSHDEVQKLEPNKVYELNIEVWPTCVVVPAGYRIGLTVRGSDYEWPGGAVKGLGNLDTTFTGVGPFHHDDPRDRPVAVFGGDVTLHVGPEHPANVLLPVIPEV